MATINAQALEVPQAGERSVQWLSNRVVMHRTPTFRMHATLTRVRDPGPGASIVQLERKETADDDNMSISLRHLRDDGQEQILVKLTHTGLFVNSPSPSGEASDSVPSYVESDPDVRAGDLPRLRADALVVTDGLARVFGRIDADGIRLFDENRLARVDVSPDTLLIQRPRDADPNVLEFLQFSPDRIVIGEMPIGGLPRIKCQMIEDGVFVEDLDTMQTTYPDLLTIRPPATETTGQVLEATRFQVESSTHPGAFPGRFDKSGLSIKALIAGDPYNKITMDGVVMTAAAGRCRVVRIRWDGVFFFDVNNRLLRKLTARGVEPRSADDQPLEESTAELIEELAAGDGAG